MKEKHTVWLGLVLWHINLRRLFNAKSIFKHINSFGQMSRVFANGPGDQGSIPGRIIPKTQKIVLDSALFSTQQYKVRIKGKVEPSWERSSGLPNTSV